MLHILEVIELFESENQIVSRDSFQNTLTGTCPFIVNGGILG